MSSISFDGLAAAEGTVILMHRLSDAEGNAITQADVATVTYTVSEIDQAGNLEPVTGHEDVSLTVADVIFDQLQTGPPWDQDAIGYNFRHTIDISEADAFPYWGRRYLVVYTVELVSGPPIVWRWIVRTPSAC